MTPKHPSTSLMFAFGSNLNKRQMARRCPDAVPLGKIKLEDWKLVFRGVADVIRSPGEHVWGGVWLITDHCERALDLYEGVGSGLYRKEYLPLGDNEYGINEMLVYCMNSTGIFPPSRSYLASIQEGYLDFGMSKAAQRRLTETVQASWDDKAPTERERLRHVRKGRPTLARVELSA
jgi:gamma-glutamylcyclotransferase (GGCT)/AIG2-like uncharacterized protein YtfP